MPTDVGIVMPVYRQRSRFLRTAIRSILHQSYAKFRLVIVLDGSPSHTRRLVRHLVHGDKRVRVISLEKNQGIAHALNRGFESLYRHTRIRYLTWVSSDNVYHRDFVYQLRRTMRRSGTHVGLVYSAFRFIDDKDQPVFDAKTHEAHAAWMNQPKEALLDSCFIGASFLYKRRHAEKTGPYRCEPVEDYEFWIRLTEHCDIQFLPKTLMDYRVNSEFSVSKQLHESGSEAEHRRWRNAFETARMEGRIRRGIPPEVTIIVPWRAGSTQTMAALESLYEQTFCNFRVIAADLSPGSAESKAARRVPDPRVTWVDAPGVDLLAAVKLGAAHAAAQTVMIYPATQALSPYHLKILVDNYQSGSAVADRGTLQALAGQTEFPPYISWEQGMYPLNAIKTPTPVGAR